MPGYSQDRCLHQLFEAQVERSPGTTAVVYEGLELTYDELNQRANQLAHYLRKRGVGPEVLVGIFMERSLDMMVGLLGILKAGGAYVPLERAYPQERLTFMLEDTRVPVLLTQPQLAVQLPRQQAEIISLDTAWEIIARENTENPISAVTPENLACVLYTSGSTGKPKGVLLHHRSVVHYAEVAGGEFAIASGDRVLQFTPLGFDTSLEEIFPCLSCGATLVLRSEAMTESFSSFLQQCHELALTVLDLPTGYWHELTTKLGPAERFAFPRSLRLVIVGGERALGERLRVWHQHVGSRVRLMNTYGPTEATVAATMCELSGTAETLAQEVPIGRAIRNVQTYILDQQLQPVPVGEPGELYIGGAGLARGYLNRPELTAERFIPHPFQGQRGARLYKTGDLARYRPDGTIEFLGRLDTQVKLRGFRVELGEIEAVLAHHPAVQQVVVVAREDRQGDKRLVAYCVPAQWPVPHSQELRHFLRKRVPDYMVPSAFVWLDTLPLTPNGKVDRHALPAPDQTRPELETAFVAPRDALERQLAKMWEAALNVKSIGVQDNFFELGGHSLLAMHLCEQMEQKFGKPLSAATLFQAPTIEQVASLLRQEKRIAHFWSLVVLFQPNGSRPPFFCVSASRALAHYTGSDQPFYTLHPHGLDGRRAPLTVEEMAAEYIKEIRACHPEGPYFLGGFSFGALVAFEMAQQLQKQGQEVALLVLLDPDRPPNSHFSPPVSASPSQSPAKIIFLRNELARHSRALALLGLQEKIVYVLERVKGKLSPRLQRIERTIKTIVCWLSLSTGCRMPVSLRVFYSIEAGAQAARRYVPHAYSGRVILFQTKARPPEVRLNWGRLIAGGFEVHEISGKHLDILREPHVQTLAAKLGTCLALAQAEGGGR